MKLILLALLALIAQASAFNAPMRARAGSSVRMSAQPDMNRRAAAFAVLGGLAAITTGADKAEAKPTWAEVSLPRQSSPEPLSRASATDPRARTSYVSLHSRARAPPRVLCAAAPADPGAVALLQQGGRAQQRAQGERRALAEHSVRAEEVSVPSACVATDCPRDLARAVGNWQCSRGPAAQAPPTRAETTSRLRRARLLVSLLPRRGPRCLPRVFVGLARAASFWSRVATNTRLAFITGRGACAFL